MLKASAFPEVWPAGPARRPCYGQYYQHPATEVSPASIYDDFGHCDPALMAAPTQVVYASPVDTGPSIWTLLAIGGIAFLVWKYRKKIF